MAIGSSAFRCLARTLLAATCFTLSCSSSSTAVDVRYDQAGELTVNNMTGAAMNGDLLARGGDGGVVRWRAATSTWEHVGKLPVLVGAQTLSARCEDAAGNVYGDVPYNGVWMLPVGTQDWVKLVIDSDAQLERPFANNKGEVVIQTRRVMPDGEHVRVYRTSGGPGGWKLASDRVGVGDAFTVLGIADSGDVFFENLPYPEQSPMVLQAGSDTLKPIIDCAGTAILPYCGLHMVLDVHGNVLFYGNIYVRHNYLLRASATYPSTAEQLYDMPTDTCCFNGGQALLPDGTFVARMNHGGYDLYYLYVRKPGATEWFQSPLLPNEDGATSVSILATGDGSLFTSSIPLGRTTSTGPVFRVRL